MIEVPESILNELCMKSNIENNNKLKYLGAGKEYSDGIVYTFKDNKGQLKVLKILAVEVEDKDGLQKFEERIKFSNFVGLNGVDLTYPEMNLSMNLYELAKTEKHIFISYIMNFCRGEHPKIEDCTAAFYTKWGNLIGRMHKVTKEYKYWLNIPTEDGLKTKGWEDEINFFYSMCEDVEVKEKWAEISKELAELPINRDSYGFIHNDNHIKNIIFDGDKITLIDFDVANCHFFINDIVHILQSVLLYQAGGMIEPVSNYDSIEFAINNFMEGYEMENHLDNFWLSKIELFVNYRRLLLYTVMQDWLSVNIEQKDKYKNMIKTEPQIYNL